MKSRFFPKVLFLFGIFLLFFGCATTSFVEKTENPQVISLENKKILEEKFSLALDKEISLKKDFKPSNNIYYMKFSGKDLIFHLVAIQITPNTMFSILPENTTLEEFSNINKATVAINGSPFQKKPFKNVGIAIENSLLLSPGISNYSALVINYENQPKIVQNQFDINLENTKIALGGFYTIIKDGNHFGSFIDNKDSRTVIGISSQNNMMYFLVVEGEFFSKSKGLSYKECGDLLLAINVENALQMDGGGSTSLYITNNNMLSYKTLRKSVINFAIIDE